MPMKPGVALCVLTCSTCRLGRNPLLYELLPSVIERTEDDALRATRLFVGLDYDDAFLYNDTGWQRRVRRALPTTFVPLRPPSERRRSLPWVELMRAPYRMNFDYFVRAHDDVTILSHGWITAIVRALQEMHNVGVVGPTIREGGASARDVVDSVHRTHLCIFHGAFHPPELADDDIAEWLWTVYATRHARTLTHVRVAHHGAPRPVAPPDPSTHALVDKGRDTLAARRARCARAA